MQSWRIYTRPTTGNRTDKYNKYKSLLESSSIRHTRHSLHVHKRRNGGLKESICGRGSSIGSPLLLPNIYHEFDLGQIWKKGKITFSG